MIFVCWECDQVVTVNPELLQGIVSCIYIRCPNCHTDYAASLRQLDRPSPEKIEQIKQERRSRVQNYCHTHLVPMHEENGKIICPLCTSEAAVAEGNRVIPPQPK